MYDRVFEESTSGMEAYAEFVAIVRQLRRDCPWDREQTHDSVKHLLIEEAYETVEAIDRKDWSHLKKELGDLLLHVIFHSAIAEKKGTFRLEEVIREETAKLVRRHPHVFGDVEVNGVDDVLSNWEQIKLDEEEKESLLDGVPAQLPALLRAHRMQEKAAGVGFDFASSDDAWEKVEEEIREYRRLVETGEGAEREEEELGDLLFSVVNCARLRGLNAENGLRRTVEKFSDRFRYIERRLAEEGRSLAGADLPEMDRLWDEAKEAHGE